MKLYSKTDLERCARLIAEEHVGFHDRDDAIAKAVEMVANDTPEVYTRDQLESVAHSAATLAVEGLAIGDAAHTAVQRL